jgi:hypothetical protein
MKSLRSHCSVCAQTLRRDGVQNYRARCAIIWIGDERLKIGDGGGIAGIAYFDHGNAPFRSIGRLQPVRTRP